MDKPQYPEPPAQVLGQLLEIFKLRGNEKIVALLEKAEAAIEEIPHDNHDWGITIWRLLLRVPTIIYAANSENLPKIEKAIGEELSYLKRLHVDDLMEGAVIVPSQNVTVSAGQTGPSSAQVQHIWGGDVCRIFISHLSIDRFTATQFKDELAKLGVAAFVAHEDIEPTKQWQSEIELALRSMHALAALITPKFHESKWTNQEIGWALGRGVPVFPIKTGADPSGFIGNIQAIPGNSSSIPSMASNMVQFLLGHASTKAHMRRGLINAFCNCGSYRDAKMLCDQIAKLSDFTETEKEMLRWSCESNTQVRDAFGVADRILNLIGGRRV